MSEPDIIIDLVDGMPLIVLDYDFKEKGDRFLKLMETKKEEFKTVLDELKAKFRAALGK